ncbi:MAG: UxaA family hydrolase, partial [Thermomicrobiales bacterium]
MDASKPRGEGMSLTSRGPSGPVEMEDVAVLLNPNDGVIIAKQPLLPRTIITTPEGEIRVGQMIPPGHKVARKAIATGGEVRRYNQIIGYATQDIAVGDHVHSHNLSVGEGLELDYASTTEYVPVEFVPEADRRTFMGYRRKNGKVGTRNYVAILASVNCSSSATQRIAAYFRNPEV